MIKALLARLRQKHRTIGYPRQPPTLPQRFRGRPVIEPNKCSADDCQRCAAACPTKAISAAAAGLTIDMGRCIFCGQCETAGGCPGIRFTAEHRLAARRRDDLLVAAGTTEMRLADALDAKMRRLFGRSLKFRQVSAGGCNACEADINVLTTVVFDIGRFGMQIVASPRHADGLLVTGPVTENMRLALEKTYAAMPAPKLVVAVGACAISGGIYADRPETHNGAASVLAAHPVDLFIPGCPPHPITILDGLLRLMGRIE